MKAGDALVGMKRRGSQLRTQERSASVRLRMWKGCEAVRRRSHTFVSRTWCRLAGEDYREDGSWGIFAVSAWIEYVSSVHRGSLGIGIMAGCRQAGRLARRVQVGLKFGRYVGGAGLEGSSRGNGSGNRNVEQDTAGQRASRRQYSTVQIQMERLENLLRLVIRLRG